MGSNGWLSWIATLATFAVGSALASAWLASIVPPWMVALVVLMTVGLAGVATAAGSGSLRALATVLLIVLHMFWLYVVLSLGMLLAWAPPPVVRWLTVLLALVAVGGALMPRARFRLPTAVPLGLWIAACLIGWVREDGVIRCDDYFAMRRSGASVLVPTTDELERCQPGESLRTGHYPRRLWEAPEGGRLVLTTQLGLGRFSPPGRVVPDRFPGTVCDVPINGTPTCFGQGKAQALVESPRRDRLFVAGWQQRFTDGNNGVLYVLSRTAPLRQLAEVHVRESVGELFYEPTSDTVGLLSDEGRALRPVRVADSAVLEDIPVPIIPGETRYDETRGEGVFCFAAGPLRRLDGEAFVSVAFRGAPFVTRALGGGGRNPTAWLSMVWGCDWDPDTRRVYAADASLGLLLTLDYDSGAIIDRTRIEFGVRYVTLDRRRHLVYLANFMDGDLVAVDQDSGDEVARWFVGRFVRQAVLTRDQRALLVTSNLGVVRVPLDGLPAR